MALTVPVLLVSLALIYQAGMAHLEGTPRSFGSALEWAAETLTTVGYGRDAHWTHPVMQAFVITAQFVGVTLIFLVFPVFIIPFLEERFEARLPTELPDLDGKVLIYGFDPAVTSLIDELARANVAVVIFEEDEALARRLRDKGMSVVLGNLEEEDPDLSRLRGARGLVVNGEDHDNAAMTLSARYYGYSGPIVALVGNPQRRPPMIRAGATTAFTPNHILAAALAERASVRTRKLASGVRQLGSLLEVAEMRVNMDTPFAGLPIAESGIRQRTGATIVGLWEGGELHRHPPVATRLAVGTIMVAVGSRESLDRLGQLTSPVPRTGPFLVLGGSEVARKVVEFLQDADEEVRVLTSDSGGDEASDGDPLDPAVLERAGLRSAQAVIVAKDADSATLFAVAVVRSAAPEAVIIAAAHRVENVSRIHRTGADFALSISQVAGQLLTYHLLGERTVSLDSEIKLVAVAPGTLAGRPLAASRIGTRTRCSVVAVQRGDAILVDIDDTFVIEPDDTVHLSGTNETIAEFYRVFPDSREKQ